MTSSPALTELPDEALHGEVKRLAGRSNTLLAELLAHLAEVEARGIHRERACASLYAYCVYELRMSEDEAQRRCRAARLTRQFPALLPMLAEAAIHLTGILLIGPHLTADNHDELLKRVRFRTKREIERLIAELAPPPPAPARIEPLDEDASGVGEFAFDVAAPPRRRNTWAAYLRSLAGHERELQSGIGAGQAPPAALPESGFDLTASEPLAASEGHEASPAQPYPTKAEPRYRLQFTVDQAFVDLLEEAGELLQHSVPRRDVVEVQRRALQALVKKLRARKFAATERPRSVQRHRAPTPEPTAPARSRHIPARVRRAVWERDTARCTYEDARGQRCRERAGLEFHHLHPHARGGPASVDNIALRCRAHNALAAEQDFGREWILEQQRARRAGAEVPP